MLCTLDPLTCLVQRFGTEFDHMEWTQHFYRLGQLFDGSCFEAGETVHRHDVDALFPLRFLLTQPGFDHGLGHAWNYVQQPCGSGAVAHGGEVHDDRDVLVLGAGMQPDMLINAQHFDSLEPGRVINEQALAFGQHCFVGAIPGDAQSFGNSLDGQVLSDKPCRNP